METTEAALQSAAADTVAEVCDELPLWSHLPSVGSWVSALPLHQPRLGDEMEALPHDSFVVDDVEYYGPGDRGRVSRNTKVDESDGIDRFEVTWYRTGKTSTMEKSEWMNHFRFIEAGVEAPSRGDEMEALPGVSLKTGGKEYYVAGDRGRVCKETSASNSDGIERFEVHWYRTGLTSTMKKEVWLQHFRTTSIGYEDPRIGNEMESLPNSSLDTGGKSYYKPFDRGRVTKETYTTPSDGIDRFEVTWYRTGLTSTMKTGEWLKYFRVVEVGIKVPNIGDELQVLPGVTFRHNSKEYYVAGDRGTVSKESSITESDGILRFEAKWYRTKATSTMKTDLWMKNFRRIVKDEHIFSATLEISKDIPFEFVWPSLQDGVYRATTHITNSWRDLGWKSKEDFEANMQRDVREKGMGTIARGITRWEAEKIARALREVAVEVRQDPEAAEVAYQLRQSDTLDKAERCRKDRERLLKIQNSLGDAALREDPDLAEIIANFTEQFDNEDIQIDELEEIESFLDNMESELGDVQIGYSGEDRNCEGNDETWSTMLHLDKEFPFDLVWPDVQEEVQHAIVSTFHLAGRSSGFTTAGEMEAALRRGVESQGRGPIARGLRKADAEQLMETLGEVLQCSIEQEHEDLTELRDNLRQRLADARDMMSDLPQSVASAFPRVEADLNDDSMFRKRHRAIESFFDRLDTIARAKPKYEICVSREQLLNSALIPILRGSPWQLRPGRLHVRYMGEDAEDAGGITRAFLIQAGALLGDANFGLFLPALRGYLQLSSLPGFLAPSQAVGDVHSHPIRWCRFLGRILGMSVVHECPLGLLLVPSLCKRLLGQEICFEDLSFAPALNTAGGGGWYNSLKRMLINNAPELVPDNDCVQRYTSAELDAMLDGIETHSFLPSRSIQTFDSMIEYVQSVAPFEERWESGIDTVACLLRGAKKQEQISRALEAAKHLLENIVSISSNNPSIEVVETSATSVTPRSHLKPSVGTWLHSSPKKVDSNSQHLPRGRRRAYQMLFAVVSDLLSSDSSLLSKVKELLHEVLGGDAVQSTLASDSEMLNIAGMWSMRDTGEAKQLYFEWVQTPGSAQFMGQEITEQGLRTLSSGSISESGIRWEVDNVLFVGKLADNGTRIEEGHYYGEDGLELGEFTGILMKSRPELKLLRPTVASDTNTWITVGAEDFASSSGKFYHEVKLGFDINGPQLGWLSTGFKSSETIKEGVGDTVTGWAFDGLRQKFYHAGEKSMPFKSWRGDVTIGLAVDIEGGVLQCSLNGEWDKGVQQTVEMTGLSIYPAVSVVGFFELRMAKNTWQYAPPDDSYIPWNIDGVLCRPPPLLDGPVNATSPTGGSPLARTSSQTAPRLERETSRVPGITENQLSSSNLPAFAEAVARKTLVTNLQPYLGPLTEEFRKITGERKLQDLTWEQLQEKIAGLQLNPREWIQKWKSRTGYTFCDESHEVVQFWWSFVEERSPEELPKLFEWCTNFPAIPSTPWKFHIQLLDDSDKIPTMNSCRTDDGGIENRGVPEPIVYLPNVTSRMGLDDKMSKVNWQKGACNAFLLI